MINFHVSVSSNRPRGPIHSLHVSHMVLHAFYDYDLSMKAVLDLSHLCDCVCVQRRIWCWKDRKHQEGHSVSGSRGLVSQDQERPG